MTPGEKRIGPDHRVVKLGLSADGHIVILQQDQWTELVILDYRVGAPVGKHRSDRHGTDYREIVYPAPYDSGTPVTVRISESITTAAGKESPHGI